MSVPVITVDGPSGVGKGTLSQRLARHLGWHFLDSGALYRVLGLAARRQGVDLSDEPALEALALGLDVRFVPSEQGESIIFMNNHDVTQDIRTEQAGGDASRVAALPAVRAALLQRQRDFRRPPGLVADGRDMGTTIFPDAPLKFFITASAEVRAERRYKQLKEKGLGASLTTLLAEIAERDERDRTRSVSPLKPAEDAIIIDTSHLGIEDVFQVVLERYAGCFGEE